MVLEKKKSGDHFGKSGSHLMNREFETEKICYKFLK